VFLGFCQLRNTLKIYLFKSRNPLCQVPFFNLNPLFKIFQITTVTEQRRIFLKELSKKEDFPSLGRRARGRAWRWMDMLYSNINVSPHQIVYDVTEGWPRTSKDQRFSAASHIATNRIVPRVYDANALLGILTMRILWYEQDFQEVANPKV